jgi:hypothetical protein
VVWTIAGRADELAPKLGAAGVTPARGDLFEVATGRLFTAPADSTILLPGPAATVQAEELMFTAIEAKGGFAALERVGSYSVEDSIWVQPGGDIVPGTRKVFVRFPDRYREELAIAALQGRGVIQVVDGKDVWRDQLGRVKTASETRRQDLLGRLWMDGLRVFHRYGEPGAQAFIVDPEVIGDVTLDGFQISSPDGYWVRLYLHPQSRLVVKRTASQPTDQGVLQTEELFTDYRPVEGVFVPFIAATYLDGEWSTEIHTLSIDFNPELPEDLFERKQF